MKIREEGQNRKKVKKEKKHGVHEKRHIVEYYLLRLYSKEDLLEKYGINSILLLQWLSWYYKYFQSQYFTGENYGKANIRNRGQEIMLGLARKDFQDLGEHKSLKKSTGLRSSNS